MKRLIVSIVSVLALLALLATPAQAYHGKGAHWPGGPTKGFVMVSDRSGGTVGNVNEAIAQWNATGVYNIVNVGPVCPNKFAPHYCITLYRSTSLASGTGVARTHIFAGNHILAADVYINPGRLDRATLRALLTHEMGHGLGLDHRTDAGLSVMKPIVQSNFFPDWHDKEQLVNSRR